VITRQRKRTLEKLIEHSRTSNGKGDGNISLQRTTEIMWRNKLVRNADMPMEV